MHCKKAIRFDEIYKFYLKLLSRSRKVLRFHHIFVAFSEYINFTHKKERLKEVSSLPQIQAEESFYLQKEHIVSQLRPSDSPVKPKGDQAPPNQCVFVSNLPFDINWEELKDLFVQKVDGGIGYVEILVQKKKFLTLINIFHLYLVLHT